MNNAATYYGANTWLIQISNVNILIDPWLTGNLEFCKTGWLLKGKLKKQITITNKIDIILLTQSLPDHTHNKTLNMFSKDIFIIASKNAAKKAKKLGFKSLEILKPGERFNKEGLTIEATAGAKVPMVENGYIIKSSNFSIYIEPHGFLDENIKDQSIDLIITPTIDFGFPLIGNIINGKSILKQLIKKFKPKLVFESTTGGDIEYKGIVGKLISSMKLIKKSKSIISFNNNVITPILGRRYILDNIPMRNQ